MKKLWFVLLLVSCTAREESTQSLDIQGHRGARGLAPENSIPGFLKALELGVHTLEMDLCVSKDGELVVSHEPYFSPVFCLDTAGQSIHEDTTINLYALDYASIRRFDCGSKGNPRFPDQQLMHTIKPTLRDAIEEVEFYARFLERPPLFYNIELKTTQATDSLFHPTPQVFSDWVYDFIVEKEIQSRVTIQSFDFRTLQYFHRTYPEIQLALLIENDLPWQTNVDSLGFVPEIYSCYYPLLTQSKIAQIQEAGMKVIPWTVNEPKDMKNLIDWGVDGLITDYPDRALLLENIQPYEQKI